MISSELTVKNINASTLTIGTNSLTSASLSVGTLLSSGSFSNTNATTANSTSSTLNLTGTAAMTTFYYTDIAVPNVVYIGRLKADQAQVNDAPLDWGGTILRQENFSTPSTNISFGVTGYYLITASVVWDTANGGRFIKLYRPDGNAAGRTRSVVYQTGINGYNVQSLTALAYVDSGQIFQITTYGMAATIKVSQNGMASQISIRLLHT